MKETSEQLANMMCLVLIVAQLFLGKKQADHWGIPSPCGRSHRKRGEGAAQQHLASSSAVIQRNQLFHPFPRILFRVMRG
jgi:hypothetical protein